MRIILFLICGLLLNVLPAQAGYLKGKITDEAGLPLPFVSVYVKNTSYGVSSNMKGEYFIQLKPGAHTMTFSLLGYDIQEKGVMITMEPVVLDVVLRPSVSQLSEVEVSIERRDVAKEVMKKARDKRKEYHDRIGNYSCKTYQKISLEKEALHPEKKDTSASTAIKDSTAITGKKDTTLKSGKPLSPDINAHFKKEKLNLIESVSEMYFNPPGQSKEIVLAHHDYAEVKPRFSSGASFSVEVGENDIAETPHETVNPYILVSDMGVMDFDFYKNFITVPGVSQKPLLSPIASTAPLNYKYTLDGIFFENGKKIYRISVQPLFKAEALFSGLLFIEDSTWALKAVDLTVNPSVLAFCRNFHIIQNYTEVEPGIYMATRREFDYTIRSGKHNILGNARIDHSLYKVNAGFPDKFFNNEVRRFEDDALEKDSLFWAEIRPLTLKTNEIDFIKQSDSLKAYYASEEYLLSSDSSYNEIDIWSFLLNGVAHRNRVKKIQFYINPLIAQVIPLGIGGYRHRLGGSFNKEFGNGMLMETDGEIDYGFSNKDVKGKAGIGLTYIPRRFVRTFIRFGDFYDLINNYSSVSTLFSRSNYARTQTFSVAQRMEIVNGLFGELTYEYSGQKPIVDLKQDQWSQSIFGSLNAPTDFEPYIKSELKLELKYRIRQKYIMKGGRKIILGSRFPEIAFVYRKAIPGLFKSEVNFDYIEAGTKHELKLPRLGTTNWAALAGSFVNKKNLRILEYKFFRGSDPWFFSDPLRSFQLLGPTLSASSAYFRANFIHHFEGALFSRVPLVNKLKLAPAAGAGTLLIADHDFAHFEMFGGLERIFRIRKQLFRFGVYAVTADNTLESADFNLKFGISFYNPFTRRWDY
jgi:hypothetical protein